MTASQDTSRTEQLTIAGCQIAVRFAAEPAGTRLQTVQTTLLNAFSADSHICASARHMGECGHLQ